MTARPVAALRPLSIPIFRAVWLASTASHFGGTIQSVAAAWMMTSLSASPKLVALVQASVTLPVLLLSMLAGALADSLDRRRIMIAAQSFMLLVSLGLALCAGTATLTPELLLVFTFLLGCGGAFHAPAWQASVGDMVPRDALPEAIALNSMGFNVSRTVGPAVGGLIVAIAGATAAFLANAVSYCGLIVVLARWRPREHAVPRAPAESPERLMAAIRSGMRHAGASPVLRSVLLRGLLFGAASSAVLALVPLVVRDLIGGGSFVYGVLLGGFGVGSILGSIARVRLGRRLSNERILGLGSLSAAAGALGVGLTHALVPAMLAMAAAGAGVVLALSTLNVAVQMASPRPLIARILSLYQMATFGGIAAGSWGFGAIAERHGVSAAFVAAASLQVVAALLGRRLPLAPTE